MISPFCKPAFSAALSLVTFSIKAPFSFFSVVTPKKVRLPTSDSTFMPSMSLNSNSISLNWRSISSNEPIDFPLMTILRLLMLISSSLNSTRAFPLINTLSSLNSMLMVVFLLPFLRTMISRVSVLGNSFPSTIISLTSCAVALYPMAANIQGIMAKNTLFMAFNF